MDELRLAFVVSEPESVDWVREITHQAHGLAARGHVVYMMGDPAKVLPAAGDRGVSLDWLDLVDPLSLSREFDVTVAVGWRSARVASLWRGAGTVVHYLRSFELDRSEPDDGVRQSMQAAYALTARKLTNARFVQAKVREKLQTRCWYVPPAVSGGVFERAAGEGRRRVGVLGAGGDSPDPTLRWIHDAIAGLQPAMDLEAVPLDPPRAKGVLSLDLLVAGTTDPDAPIPLLALEALSAGIPVVLTDVRCHHEFSEGNRHAVFVPPGDAPSLSRCVKEILTDRARAESLSLAGQTVAREFARAAQVGELERVLVEIDGEAPRLRLVSHAPTASTRAVDRRSIVRESQYRFAAQLVSGLRVLDVGCGNGSGTALLAAAGGAQVEGIDISEIAIGYAKREFALGSQVAFRVASAYELGVPPSSMDLVVALNLVEDLDDPGRFFEEVQRVLTSQGALLVSIANDVAGGEDAPGLQLDRAFRLTDVRSLLETCFGRVTVFGQAFESGQLVFRPNDLAGDRDAAFLLLASQEQRRPIDPLCVPLSQAVTERARRHRAA
jgi:2-polyprenyl-3-methyl-5-hydroxy-6-metoxy-1,4-benzoquinol methylase